MVNSTVTVRLENVTEGCLDGWVFSNEKYKTIVTEWELVCDRAWIVPFTSSGFYFGALIGSFAIGQLSDRFGRKLCFFGTMASMTSIVLILAASVNWVMFFIVNCLLGVAVSSNYITSLVLGSEILGKSARVNFVLLGHSLGFAVGYACLPLFAYLICDWRMLLVALAMPGLLFFPVWWVIPESPRWLLLQNRVEEAERIMRGAAKMNRIPAPEVMFKADDSLQPMQNSAEGEQQKYTYLDLVRTTNMRNITVLCVIVWLGNGTVYYGLCLFTGSMHGNAFLNTFLSSVTEMVIYFTGWLLSHRVPRSTMLVSTMLFCGIVLLLVPLVPEDIPVLSQVFALLGKLGASGGFSFLFLFTTELFPTVVRNMGVGLSSTSGRLGGIAAPYIIFLGVYSKILPYILFGVISIMAATLSFLLPDTRNKKFPDDISQVNPISCQCPAKKTTKDQQPQLSEKYP